MTDGLHLCECGAGPHVSYRSGDRELLELSLDDVVAWLTEQGMGEVVEAIGFYWPERVTPANRYLVVPIGEAITKEDE